MNKKVSGAKAVVVPIKNYGKNYIPYVEDLADRIIKYIDFYPTSYLPDTNLPGVDITPSDAFISLIDVVGNGYLVKDMPLERLSYSETNGRRESIFNKISLQNSYITITDMDLVGKNILLIFWYDLPFYSAKNSTDTLITDSLNIPITTIQGRNILSDDERMNNKRFRSILLGRPSVLPDYSDGIGYPELFNIYITLRKGSYNVIENVPLILFYQIDMIERTEFANIIFDLNNSYLTVGGAGTVDNPEDYNKKSVFINLTYER